MHNAKTLDNERCQLACGCCCPSLCHILVPFSHVTLSLLSLQLATSLCRPQYLSLTSASDMALSMR